MAAFAVALAVPGRAARLGGAGRDEPLIDLRFFRSVPFSGAAVIAVAAFATLGGFLFLNTLYLQEVRGFSPLQAGLDTLPMAVMTMVLPPISGRIVGTRGARIPLLVAGAALTVELPHAEPIGATTPFAWLFAAYVVFGIGFGFVNAPITNAAVSGMPRAQAGVASAIASTSRQVGQTLGVAVVGSLLASASVVPPGCSRCAVSTHAGWLVLAGCGVVVLGARTGGDDRGGRIGRPSAPRASSTRSSSRGRRDGDRTAARLAPPKRRRARGPGRSWATWCWTTSGAAR